MKDMGNVSLTLGMQITRDRAEGKLKSQANFVKSILERYGMSECNAMYTLATGPDLSVTQPDDNFWTPRESSSTKQSLVHVLGNLQPLRHHIRRQSVDKSH